MMFSRRPLAALAGLLVLTQALPAAAHPGHGEGWMAGFSHPLQGWDHLLVMVAVGLWAAQHTGRARWLIPGTFVAVMAVGAVAGAWGITVPGVEAMILASVIALAGLVLMRKPLPLAWAMAVVGLFAFFHGFAHGQELPDASQLRSFGAGFLAATAILHALGYAAGRIISAIAARRIRHA